MIHAEKLEKARSLLISTTLSITQAQQLNEDQIQELRDIVAWRLMGNDVTDEQAKWRDDAIMRSQSTSLIERRVRMALGTGDRRGLNTWLCCVMQRTRFIGGTGLRVTTTYAGKSVDHV